MENESKETIYMPMKVAKPSEEDFNACYQFLRIMEGLSDKYTDPSDWKEHWDEDDEDYILIKEMEQQAKWDECLDDDDDIDQRLVMWEYVKHFFNHYPSAFARVLICANIAMDNCFDNTDATTTIEWNKAITEALELAEKNNQNVSK